MSPENAAPVAVPSGRRRAPERGGIEASAKRVARDAETRTPLRAFARSGFAANGVVHAVAGIIILVIAGGGRGEGDQAGAMKAIATAPLGFIALWFVAIALGALAVWHLLEGFLVRADSDGAGGETRKWGRRTGEWSQALVFGAVAAVAASVALGARPDSEDAAEGASRGVLSLPGGPVLLDAVGLAIGVCGVAFLVMGVRRSFRQKMDLPPGGLGRGVAALGAVGFVAKGAALMVVGVLLLVAAVTLDPSAAGGLDGAVDALLALAYGPWLVGLVGAGLVAYGAFCLLRARYARL